MTKEEKIREIQRVSVESLIREFFEEKNHLIETQIKEANRLIILKISFTNEIWARFALPYEIQKFEIDILKEFSEKLDEYIFKTDKTFESFCDLICQTKMNRFWIFDNSLSSRIKKNCKNRFEYFFYQTNILDIKSEFAYQNDIKGNLKYFLDESKTKIIFPENFRVLKGFFFNKNKIKVNEIIFSENLEEICEFCFENLKVHNIVKNLCIPKNVKFIANGAFKFISSLEKVIVEGKTEIDYCAFRECKNLKIFIGKNVKKIGDECFENCEALSKIELNYDVEIGEKSFIGTKLKKLNLKNGKIEKNAFISNSTIFYLINKCDIVKIPSSVTEIDKEFFLNIHNSKKLFIPSSVQKIQKQDLEIYSYIDSAESVKISEIEIKTTENAEKFDSLLFPNASLIKYKNEKTGKIFKKFLNTRILTEKLMGEWFSKNSTLKNCPHLKSEKLETLDFYSLRHSDFSTFKIPSTVKKIDAEAFLNCLNLSKIEIPDSVEEIAPTAFQNCNITTLNHKALKIENGFVIKNGDLISFTKQEKNVVIPDGVKTISRAFANSNIESVFIPKSVESIATSFLYCCSLKEVIFEEGSNCKAIYDNSFENCISLEKIKLPSKLVHLSISSFKNCTSLKEIEFSDEIEVIPHNCFINCTSLEKIKFPKKLKYIDNGAFAYCFSLKKIVFPENLVEIKPFAFAHCTSLCEIEVSENTEIGKFAFSDCNILNFNQKNLKIENGFVTKDEVLICSTYQREKILASDFPKNVKVITQNAFRENSSLKEIEIPNQIKEIENNAFYNLYIERIYIPSSTEIEIGTFDSSKIKKIESDDVKEIKEKILTKMTNFNFMKDYDYNENVFLKKYILYNSCYDDSLNLYFSCEKSDEEIEELLKKIIEKISKYTEKNDLFIQTLDFANYIIENADDEFKKHIGIDEDNVKLFDSLFKREFVSKYLNHPLFEKSEYLLLDLGYENLKKIVLPPQIKVIGSEIFRFSNLEEIELSENLEIIGFEAFANCKNLKMPKINKNIKIYPGAFF